jgi:hypothetical protein
LTFHSDFQYWDWKTFHHHLHHLKPAPEKHEKEQLIFIKMPKKQFPKKKKKKRGKIIPSTQEFTHFCKVVAVKGTAILTHTLILSQHQNTISMLHSKY